MNDLYADLNEVEQELKFLESRFSVLYHSDKGIVKRVSLSGNVKEVCKNWSINRKDLIRLLDWLEEPKQLEAINYLRK